MPQPDRDVIALAEAIAERELFPRALATDAAELLPLANLDLLAEAGLYGLAGPAEAGGLDADPRTAAAVTELLASGCLTTTFVFVQHHRAVRAVRDTANQSLRDDWLAPLCNGTKRAGIVLAGLRAGATQLMARQVEGGWLLDGNVPWVTGWGRIDVLLAMARTGDGKVVRALIDATPGEHLRVQPLRLIAANASGTAAVTFQELFVPAQRITSIEDYVAPPANEGGGRGNGSLPLGIARRCIALIGETPLHQELADRRNQLDEASDETMAAARAAAADLAMRAAASLVVTKGGSSLLLDQHAQRLACEAVFTLVFGTRPAIRAHLLDRLGASPTP
jgi:alkylation response protein AidB-like acyl-CoA dehydrogenase